MSRPLSSSVFFRFVRLLRSRRFGRWAACSLLASSLSASLLPSPTFVAAQETPPAATQEVDPYALPASDSVEELQEYIAKLSQIRPDGVESYERHMDRLPAALEAAARRILELETDPKSDAYEQAEFLVMVARVLGASKLTPEGRSGLIDEMAGRLDGAIRIGEEAGLASQLASAVLALGERDEAIRAYRIFGAKIAATNQPDVANLGKRLEGIARRLDLIGQPFEIEGELVDGSTIDWSAYRGKVVLIDFWATWCGPCLREQPRLIDLHRAYGEDGFAVIAVSLDADRSRLEQYLETDPLPWPCLFRDRVGWDHPLALKYGVEGLPTTILVDRSGNVTHVDIRSEELLVQVPKLLGVPAKLSGDDPPPPRTAPSGSAEPSDDDGEGQR